MTINYGGEMFYNTNEVCNAVGITSTTLLKLLNKGLLKNTTQKIDNPNMFTEDDVRKLKTATEKAKLVIQMDLFIGEG